MHNHAKTDLNEFLGEQGETLNADRDEKLRELVSTESGEQKEMRVNNAYDDQFTTVNGG